MLVEGRGTGWGLSKMQAGLPHGSPSAWYWIRLVDRPSLHPPLRWDDAASRRKTPFHVGVGRQIQGQCLFCLPRILGDDEARGEIGHLPGCLPGCLHGGVLGTQARALRRTASAKASPILASHPGAAADGCLQRLAWRLSQTWRLNKLIATPCSRWRRALRKTRWQSMVLWALHGLMAGCSCTAPESGRYPRREMTWLPSERRKAKIPATGVECGLWFRAPRLLNPLERPTNQRGDASLRQSEGFPVLLTGLPLPHCCRRSIAAVPDRAESETSSLPLTTYHTRVWTDGNRTPCRESSRGTTLWPLTFYK